jgi:DNA-binding transcriptional LysR family regulator
VDRLDAMAAFAAAVDEGGLAAAARRLGRSPAAVTRAVALLEQRTGARLLHRTTRVVRLTEAGERYLATCRNVLAELAEAETLAAGERATPQGMLTVTAPAVFGRLHIRPLVDLFLDTYPAVQVRLLLLDRVVNLIEEGVDVALRIGQLPDSGLTAVKLGEVRRVICASPAYLTERPPIVVPADLARHTCISFAEITANDIWTFAAGPNGGVSKHVRVRPRLTVNGADAAIASAIEGRGITCVLSYQIGQELSAGRLVLLLEAYEPTALPVHLVYAETRVSSGKTRSFIDLVVPRLRAMLAQFGAQPGGSIKR